ncbi:hypothetical protein FXV77_09525 [Sphingobacterium phlebotomi]|uniref:YubB ferredoxin-like domain-containing protein n=1 Tax=Sphingobacterium phlebotomi TaxID=2605433 RepID=A0A5D4HBG1_9SPHI|nr:hypothetical protein [Sphingobacterium phlebotomi]TYR36150.1 hypothetical protein FXV77_09525 [Sphingobacterium phlebotomi]
MRIDMANYCYNHIIFDGTAESLYGLIKFINESIKQHAHDDTSRLDLKRLSLSQVNDDLIAVFGARNFEVCILEYNSGEGNRVNVLHSIPTDTDSLATCGQLILTGESPWLPIHGLISILCKKFSLRAEYDYEEGCNYLGRAFFNTDGSLREREYDNYWEALAALEPDRYQNTAMEDFEQFEDVAEFSDSELLLYAPIAIKDKLLHDYEQYYSFVDR